MTTLLTNELLPFCIMKAGLTPDRIELIDPPERELLRRELFQGLLELGAEDGVLATDPRTHSPVSLGSVVHSSDRPGAGLKVVAFSFSNMALEASFALAGLLLAGHANQLSIGALGSIGTVFKGLYTSIATLRSPQDDDAIAVLRAIAVQRMQARWARTDERPSNSNLVDATHLEASRLANALRLLESRKIIRNEAWGGRSADYTAPDNRWALKI